MEQCGDPRHWHVGCELARQARIVGRQRGTHLGFRERRRNQILLPKPPEYIIAFGGLLLRQTPARERRGAKTLRVARGSPTFEPVADQQRIGNIRRARQEPIPAASLGKTHQPIVPQAVRHRLTRMRLQERVDRRVQGSIVGLFDQIAAEPRRNDIVVYCVGFERGRIRRFRKIQANPLHGRYERLTGAVRIGGGRPRGAGGSGEWPKQG